MKITLKPLVRFGEVKFHLNYQLSLMLMLFVNKKNSYSNIKSSIEDYHYVTKLVTSFKCFKSIILIII